MPSTPTGPAFSFGAQNKGHPGDSQGGSAAQSSEEGLEAGGVGISVQDTVGHDCGAAGP